MRKTSLLFFILSVLFSSVSGQAIQQIGYYTVNGIMALSSQPGHMILGNGDVVDITIPTSPSLSGNISTTALGSSVLVSGNYAYIGTGMQVKLVIADITNSNAPVQAGVRQFPSTSGGIFGMYKSGNILYLAMGTAGIFTVDVSNPANPVVLDSLVIPNGQCRDVITHQNYAFVAHADGLKVIDITDPSDISAQGTAGSGYNSIDIDDINDRVFLGKTSGGTDVYDISTPLLPVFEFAIPNSGGTAWDLKYRNNLLYLATNSSGLFIYKILANSGVEMTSFPNTSNGQSFGVALQDSLILLSGLINGVAILKYDSTGTTGIDEPLKNKIALMPNPCHDYFEVTSDKVQVRYIKICNMMGEIVADIENIPGAKHIDVSQLPPGNYIVSLESDAGITSRKLIRTE